MRWLARVEFAYNNSRKASNMMGPFDPLFGYHPRIFYKDNRDPQSKSRVADKNAAVLHDLTKELKLNLAVTRVADTTP